MSNAGLGLQSTVDYDELASRYYRAERESADARTPARQQGQESSQDFHAARARRTGPSASRERIAERDGVRTIKIRGQATPPRRRPSAQIARYDQHPDRAAQWALFLGVFMVVVAIVTGS